jgi:hypothetical protein
MPAVTNTNIASLNTAQTLTESAATSSTIDATEQFTITPTGKDSKTAILFSNATGHGAYTFSIAAGTGVFASPTATTGSIGAGLVRTIQIETGKFINASNQIVITLTPATGKRLATDHVAKVYELELL